jgi:hypothetical protein
MPKSLKKDFLNDECIGQPDGIKSLEDLKETTKSLVIFEYKLKEYVSNNVEDLVELA